MASKVRPRSSATKARDECDDFNTSTLAYKGPGPPWAAQRVNSLFHPSILLWDLDVYLGEKQ